MATKKRGLSKKYELKLDLRVLDHLGMGLYSNAAAVLSEAVANTWDADARLVKVDISPDVITIEDDGVGMDLAAINTRFLSVGYHKRAVEGDISSKGRPFMGRKGIGKLALFSIAGEIEVHTRRARGERHAFRMVTADIRKAVKAGKKYYPLEIPFSGPAKGTRIILRELTKKRTGASVSALRKRIARRFSIIGYVSDDGDRFSIEINGDAVGPADREDLKAIEFLWEFGDKHVVNAADCPKLKQSFLISSQVLEGKPAWKVRGWIGTAAEPKALNHDEAGPMNGLVVFARGRLIQENILDKLHYSRILVSYVVGQVEADFLDVKDEDDIATSDRQRLVEDDARYEALSKFLRETLLSIQGQWNELRNEARGKQALEENPALEEWLATLPSAQRPVAERTLGLIRSVELEDEAARKDLYRSGVLAFERLRLREATHLLSALTSLTADNVLPLLSDLAGLEGALYRDIVKARLEVIKEFKGLVDANEKGKVLQKHLFENLWLLDPGWERAAGSDRVEQTLKKEYGAFSQVLNDDQSKGRVDIRYKTNAGQHIIVELKRAGRQLTLGELIDQGAMYKNALTKCLAALDIHEPFISVVFVVGKPVEGEDDPGGPRTIADTLKGMSARVVHYEKLIDQADASYSEYLAKSADVDRIEKILQSV